MKKNKYCEVEWWINQIENKCETIQKESEEYKRSDLEFKIFLIISFFIFVLGIIGYHIYELYGSVLLLITSILVSFTYKKYKNRSNILENASLLRPKIFKKMIQEMGNKGILRPSQVKKCIRYINEGAAQMSKSGKEGLTALKDIVMKVIREICS